MSPLERADRLRRPSLAVAVSSGCLYISSGHWFLVGSTFRRPPLGRAAGRSGSRAAGRWRRSTWKIAPLFSHTECILPLTCRLCRFRPRSLAPADFISVLANVVGKKADRRRHGPHRSVCRTSRSLKIKYCGSELLVCFRTQFCRGASDSQEGMGIFGPKTLLWLCEGRAAAAAALA